MKSKRVCKIGISMLLILVLTLSTCFTQVFAEINVENVVEAVEQDVAAPETSVITGENPVETIDDQPLTDEVNNGGLSVIEDVYSIPDDGQVIDIPDDTDIIQSKKTNRFIIKYRDESKRSKVINKIKGKVKSARNLKNKKFDVITTELKIEEFISEIKNNNVSEDIEYIQPDYEVTLSTNDTNFVNQWGLENNTVDQLGINIDSNVVPAWNETEGSGITVAIIDTGVDTTHKDLIANLWVNEREIPDNNIDDDLNGYVDDINGWNFYDDSNELHRYELSYDEGHGTHIAGIISAEKDNTWGIAGVAPRAKIMPLKTFSNGTAYTSDIIEAIEYAQKMGARVVNCSWGSAADNPVLREVMSNSSMFFVCAAGNSHVSIDSEPVYPACFGLDNMITVASIGRTGELSSFSNYGEINVDVAAPGEDITSTLPGNRYGQKSGTSMSTPFVSGQAALLLSKYSDISCKDLKDRIINCSDRLPTLLGKVKRANKINIANSVLGLASEEVVELKEKEEVEVPPADNVTVPAVNDGGFTTYSEAGTYSAVQEALCTMFPIPGTSMNGMLNAIVRGNTRTNKLKSPEMDKDSDGNGIVDNFGFYKDPVYNNYPDTNEVIHTFDTAEQCQKLEITKSSDTKGACINQSFNVTPGQIINASCEAKVEGNVRAILIITWFNSGKWVGSANSISCTNTEYTSLNNINRVVPDNVDRVSIQMWIYPLLAGGNGSAWFKKVVAETKSSTEYEFNGINVLNSPAMDEDSDGDGVVNDFNREINIKASVNYVLDTTEQCQKIELTNTENDTAKYGTKVCQWFDVNPGDVVSMACQTKVQGNVRARFYIAWFNGNTCFETSPSIYSTSTDFSQIKSANWTAPANTTRAQIVMRAIPLNVGDTGSVWFKNAVVEIEPSSTSFITTGTISTEPTRIKSVGKNLFSDQMYYNYVNSKSLIRATVSEENNKLKFVSTGDDAMIYTYGTSIPGAKMPELYYKFALPVTSSSMYYSRKVENLTAGHTNEYVFYYDEDRRFISLESAISYVNGTIMSQLSPPSNAKYLHIILGAQYSGQTVYYSDFMLSSENIPFEQYKESTSYIPVSLNSLSNVIKDEVNVNTGVYTKRLEKVTANKGTWQNTSYTNFNIYEYQLDTLNILPGSIIKVDGIGFSYSSGDSDVAGYYYNWSDAHDSQTGNNNITLRYPKTATAPSKITVVYQIPQVEVSKIDVTPVTSFSGGTVFIDNAVKKVGVYNNGIAIMDKGLPISEMESIYKIKSGVRTLVSISKVTVNSDGTAFTISDAQWGEMYEYVYKYDSSLSTIPTIQYSTPVNLEAQVEDNTNVIKQHSDIISYLIEQIKSLREQIENPKRVNAGPFKISCTAGVPFNVVLTAANSKDFSSRKFTVIYNTSEVSVKDLCAATPTLETGVCNPADTNISIVKAEPGLIEFIIFNPVEQGKAWSGAVNTIVFTPKTGVASATITYIAE